MKRSWCCGKEKAQNSLTSQEQVVQSLENNEWFNAGIDQCTFQFDLIAQVEALYLTEQENMNSRHQ